MYLHCHINIGRWKGPGDKAIIIVWCSLPRLLVFLSKHEDVDQVVVVVLVLVAYMRIYMYIASECYTYTMH